MHAQNILTIHILVLDFQILRRVSLWGCLRGDIRVSTCSLGRGLLKSRAAAKSCQHHQRWLDGIPKPRWWRRQQTSSAIWWARANAGGKRCEKGEKGPTALAISQSILRDIQIKGKLGELEACQLARLTINWANCLYFSAAFEDDPRAEWETWHLLLSLFVPRKCISQRRRWELLRSIFHDRTAWGSASKFDRRLSSYAGIIQESFPYRQR